MADNRRIIIEFSLREIEILCGAIAHFVPSDRSHEMILSMLYVRLEEAMKKSLGG